MRATTGYQAGQEAANTPPRTHGYNLGSSRTAR